MADALTKLLERRIRTQRASLRHLWDRLMEASGTQHWRRWFMLAKRLDGENREFRAVLQLASTWGMASDGYDATTAIAIKEWVDGGFKGEPPRPLLETSDERTPEADCEKCHGTGQIEETGDEYPSGRIVGDCSACGGLGKLEPSDG